MGARGGTDPNTVGRSLPESVMGRPEEQVLNIGGFGVWWPWMWGFPGGSDSKESTCNEGAPGSQASSRGEAKDSALLSSRDAGLLEPPERTPSLAVVHGLWSVQDPGLSSCGEGA